VIAAEESDDTLSAECTVARQAGYESLHKRCKSERNISLPYSTGVLLVKACTCRCHDNR
jgi:hypothetical protein